MKKRDNVNFISARKSKGLTQSELARLIGTSQSYVAAIEKGIRNLSLDKAKQIARHLDVCDPISLVGGINNQVSDGFERVITVNHNMTSCSIVEMNGQHMLLMPDGTIVPGVIFTRVHDEIHMPTTALVKLIVNLKSLK